MKALFVFLGIATVGTLIGWGFFFGTQDLGCTDPQKSGTLSTCESSSDSSHTASARATTTRPPSSSAPSSTIVPTTTPRTSRPSTTSAPRTTTTAQAVIEKKGTLYTFGTPSRCTGFLVQVGGTVNNNGVSFTVEAQGNNTPRITIVGQGNFTYPGLCVVTGGEGGEFNTGYTQSAPTAVPGGKVSLSYDILNTTEQPLRGVLVRTS